MRKGLLFILLFVSGVSHAQVNLISCNNWLSTHTQGSYVTVGDLDVSGNQVTVEALVNRTDPLNSGLYYGHLVSKHTGPADVNYALLPNGCEITTTTGYHSTFQNCQPDLNKNYHVAMVYDGNALKFYKNGYLMSQVPCTGNMITNNLLTTICQYAGGASTDEQVLGYTNEVRIWNTARTQTELRTYMDVSLPNPATQPGLLGYYVFDNLLNKQGNTAYNGVLHGAGSINATNSTCNFIADSCALIATACDNWLSVQTQDSKIAIGDLDISGNQLTVEATYNRTQPLNSGLYGGHLVSKHTGPFDDNYSIFPNGCALTTTTGYYGAFETCPFQLNKTYHVAMVYDGASLKFYHNGFLMSETPCTGNLINNDITATIGDYAGPHDATTQFLGYENEVRLWNVARTQSQIRTYMYNALPNPTTQVGLIGYYVFDDLQNKQGNTAYDGISLGTTSLNATNPNCNFIVDSCDVIIPLTLLEFNGKLVNENAELNWKTNGEINMHSFNIERSIDGRIYTSVGRVDAISQPGTQHYEYTDTHINSLHVPVIYYRLKQIDMDGRFTYSPIVTIAVRNKNAVLVYPNPVSDKINCTVNTDKFQQVWVKLVDNAGKVLQQQVRQLVAGSSAFTIYVSNLATGMYTIELVGETINYHATFIKR